MTSFYKELFAALPDLRVTTFAVAADEDTVWCRFVVEGTNEGGLFGFPATGETVRWDEIDTHRVADGKIVEEWSAPIPRTSSTNLGPTRLRGFPDRDRQVSRHLGVWP
jgi:predicted ester cyclase